MYLQVNLQHFLHHCAVVTDSHSDPLVLYFVPQRRIKTYVRVLCHSREKGILSFKINFGNKSWNQNGFLVNFHLSKIKLGQFSSLAFDFIVSLLSLNSKSQGGDSFQKGRILDP